MVLDLLKPSDGMNRCWAVDYSTAIQRKHVKGGEFGLQKLSNQVGIPYIGGISALPRFILGETKALSVPQIDKLATVICDLIRRWDLNKATSFTIQCDRRTTLMKKFPAFDVALEAELHELLPDCSFDRSFRIAHPLGKALKCPNAGVTEFNLVISRNNRRVFLFVAATFDTTHKHKEVAGRLRGAFGCGAVLPTDMALLVIDGNLLYGAHRDVRMMMLQNAGWSGAYFLDETRALVKHIDKFLRTGETTLEPPRLKQVRGIISIPSDGEILLAAENSDEAPKLKRKGGHG
jgi:hypothetical protein